MIDTHITQIVYLQRSSLAYDSFKPRERTDHNTQNQNHMEANHNIADLMLKYVLVIL